MSKNHLNYLRRKTADEAELWAADRIEQLEAERDRQLAEAQARIDELTTMCEDLVCEAKDFAYKLEQKTVQLVEAQAQIETLKTTPPDKREDLRCVISDMCEQVRERDKQLTHCQAALALKTEALYLYRNAGNPAYDEMVKQAIAIKPNNSALREWGARLLEEVGNADQRWLHYQSVLQEVATKLRSGEWTPEVMK